MVMSALQRSWFSPSLSERWKKFINRNLPTVQALHNTWDKHTWQYQHRHHRPTFSGYLSNVWNWTEYPYGWQGLSRKKVDDMNAERGATSYWNHPSRPKWDAAWLKFVKDRNALEGVS